MVLSTLSEVSAIMASKRTTWAQRLPEGSPARSLNFPLIYLIVQTYDYEGALFARDLANGIPIVGHVPSSHVLTNRDRGANSSIGHRRNVIPMRHKLNVERAKRAHGTAAANERWGKTLTDFQRGWVT